MENRFFEKPILNSPYKYPQRHWELDAQGQPTQQIIEKRRRAEFITPIPKPKKRKAAAGQQDMIFDEGKGLSTQKQRWKANLTRLSGNLHPISEGKYVCHATENIHQQCSKGVSANP